MSTPRSDRPRVAVFDRYWSIYGGGEQVAGAIARSLAPDHDVVLLGPEPIDAGAMMARLGIDLSGCGYRRVSGDDGASAASAEFDLFINATYGSSAMNLAPRGLYYVHFPGPPPSPRQQLTRTVARVLAPIVNRAPGGRSTAMHRRLERRASPTAWTRSYTTFASNSSYTAGWVTRLWNVPSTVLYPPVRPVSPPGAKAPIVASVGRFFEPRFGHCKRQLDLVRAFVALEAQGGRGWRMELIGGADAGHLEYAQQVHREAQGHPVGVHVNAPRSLVSETLSAASIYWHGGGLGEHPTSHPERFEHFGISVVEAMAAGAVPIVFGAGGPAEVVRHGVDGFHWRTLSELTGFTRDLIDDRAMLTTMSHSAQARAREFSPGRFDTALRDTLTACGARTR